MTGRPAVRQVEPGDEVALARLFAELGHPGAAAGLGDRLAAGLRDRRAVVLVAVDHREVVGVAALAFFSMLHEPRSRCRITALVVDAGRRGQGIGRALVAAAEAEAAEAGCRLIEVTSAVARVDGHRFYRDLGFEQPSQHFVKRL